MASQQIAAITNWDAVLSSVPAIYIPPGHLPRGAVTRADGVYLRRGLEVIQLSGSAELANRLYDEPILIIVEADERTCRMTRIPNKPIGQFAKGSRHAKSGSPLRS